MLAPYDLRSQYWPLEEQEKLYRNSESLSKFFSLLLTQAWSLSLSSDQLVITKYPHLSYSNHATTQPDHIPVLDYLDVALLC